MRDTLGQLEVDFTYHQIVSSGDLENIKDKIAKQDHLIKVQKQTIDDRYSDLSSQIKSLQEMISQQSKVIRTLQDENQSLHKKTQQITKTNQVLQESENTLKAEINFLKEQVTALWQNTRHTSDEINQPDTTSASSVQSITSDKRPGTPTPSTTETSSPSITPNIPTENRFIPLRDHGESGNTSNSRQDIDVVNNAATTSPKTNPPNQRGNGIPTQPPSFPAVVDKCVFLCDSNGKFLDKKKLFPSGQDFTFFRCPTTTHARTILQDEINKEPEHPKLILIHSGTNDLTPTTLIDDFIPEISVFITQVSTMFPKSKIIYSTLLPRADISSVAQSVKNKRETF